jgi:hypothetical protein
MRLYSTGGFAQPAVLVNLRLSQFTPWLKPGGLHDRGGWETV